MTYLKSIYKYILLFSLCFNFVFFSGCTPNTSPSESKKHQQAFETYMEQQFIDTVTSSTLILHSSLKNPQKFGIKRQPATFGKNSLKDFKDEKTQLKQIQTKLKQIDSSVLTKEQRFVYAILDYYLDTTIELSSYSLYQNSFSPNTGLSTQLPITMAEYKFYNEEDIKNYLSLINQIDTLFENYIEIEKERAKQGLFMADFSVDRTLAQIDTFLMAEQNPFVVSFNDRIKSASFLSEDQKHSYTKNNFSLVKQKVIPAYQNLKKELSALKGSGKNEGGICSYKNGKDYYAILVKMQTGSQKTPPELIKQLNERISMLIKELHLISKKSPSAFQAVYSLTFDDHDCEKILNYLKETSTSDYPKIKEVKYSVTDIPSSLQNRTTAAFYMIPPLDDSTENSIRVNRFSTSPLLPTLAHEGYPGHLYQTNYFREHNSYPLRHLLNFTGYTEGWGFYVENLSYQYLDFGPYSHLKKELCDIYRINHELNYAIASLSDLYVNYEGYSREKLQNFLKSFHIKSQNADSIFETVVEEPTIYLKYYIGYLEIVNLKSKSQQELGKDFNLKEFHKIILDAGPCPFFLLEAKINSYLY